MVLDRTAPTDAVVLDGAAHPVVGHPQVSRLDPIVGAKRLPEERPQLCGAAVDVRSPRAAHGGSRRAEGADHCVDVAAGQRRLVAADDAIERDAAGGKDRRPDMLLSVEHAFAQIGAEHHRPVVRRVGDDRDRPIHLLALVGDVRQQFHDNPAPDDGGGYGFGARVPLLEQRLALFHELP